MLLINRFLNFIINYLFYIYCLFNRCYYNFSLNSYSLMKSLKNSFSVIPVKTGLQYYQVLMCSLDTRTPIKVENKLRWYDNFLRVCQNLALEDW